MKKIILFFCLCFCLETFGQGSLVLTKDSLRSRLDTVKLNADSLCLRSNLDNYSFKIVIIKEDKYSNFFKYLLPIITLLLGIVINKGLDYFSDRRRILKTGKRWIAEIRCLESPIKMQIEVLEKYLKAHSQNSFQVNNLTTYSILDCEVFKSLDKGDLLKFIEITKGSKFKEAVKLSNNVHGFISVLSYWFNALKSLFESHKSETKKIMDSLNSNLQNLLGAFADFGVLLEMELGENPIHHSNFKLITDLFTEEIMPKRQSGDYNVFELEVNFFMPLLNILADMRLDKRTKPLSKYTSSCINDIKSLRLENQYYTEGLEMVISSYSKQLDELSKLIKAIEN